MTRRVARTPNRVESPPPQKKHRSPQMRRSVRHSGRDRCRPPTPPPRAKHELLVQQPAKKAVSSGGPGGVGGFGGRAVGNRGNYYGGLSEQDDGSNGARGGNGGNGGDGGTGAGGNGGPSVCVMNDSTSPIALGGNTFTPGAPGAGGVLGSGAHTETRHGEWYRHRIQKNSKFRGEQKRVPFFVPIAGAWAGSPPRGRNLGGFASVR